MENRADVLIVTVTNVESHAVLRAFERATGQKARVVSVGERVYRDLGTLQGARTFLALSEMGTGGLGASQQAVQKGIVALQPAAVIMVGIAFGVNEQKQELGDILVSRQLMLYDLQRIGPSQIVPRGDRPHGSAWLLDYLKSADLDWTGARVRFGLLLTGDKLVDNIDYRDQLQRLAAEAIGGEMEGAGLYVACQDAKVDWVLVKGICDWADGSKAQDKDTRQQQAAENSAAFVVHALQHAAFNRSIAPAPEDAAQSALPRVSPASGETTARLGSPTQSPNKSPSHIDPSAALEKLPRPRSYRPAIILASLALLFLAALLGAYRWLAQHGPVIPSSQPGPQDMILVPVHMPDMGANGGSLIRPRSPAKSFWIDRAEVAVADFNRCTECWAQKGGDCNQGVSGRENHPINCVNYFQASFYCRKLGKRLPTEAEWEYAARGAGAYDSSGDGMTSMGRVCWRRQAGTCAIGATPADPRGLMDMLGNVWEWTLNLGCDTPGKACGGATEGIARGGSWASTGKDFVNPTSSYSYILATESPYVGFRCVKDRAE